MTKNRSRKIGRTAWLFTLTFCLGISLSTLFFHYKEDLGSSLKVLAKKKTFSSTLSADEKEAYQALVHTIHKAKKKKYASFPQLLWDIYPKFIRLNCSPYIAKDPLYDEKGYKEGMISPCHVEAFKASLKETMLISQKDYDPNYVMHPNLTAYEEALNRTHKLYVLGEAQLEALAPILEELKEPIAACLGTPWSVINVLCWETFPEAIDTAPNDWHRDGMPFAVNKVMVYLSGTSLEMGTTNVKLADGTDYHVEGPAGRWLLFKVSELLHKGRKPKMGSRLVLEVRVIPALNFDLRPYCAGYNAHYPVHPAYQPLAMDTLHHVKKPATPI